MKKIFAITTMAVVLSGCVTVQKQWQANGGSKADGVVKVAYEVLDVEIAQVNESQAVETAAESCKAWGYTGAQPFGLETKTCNVYYGKHGSSSCKSWLVSRPFQCTGSSRSN